jgi:2-polyprenyl-3-methyl-5-hydroxy-6-metoxy-1,4-benzoquinol methylase
VKQLTVIDHLVSKASFDLVLDKESTALKTIPELTEPELQKYYPKTGYASHQIEANNLRSKIYARIKRMNFRTKHNWIRKYATKGHMLDYGTGNGDFAIVAQQQGWHVDVYETSQNALDILKQRQLSVVAQPLQASHYDVITLWHAFEHINIPKAALDSFFTALRPGGLLVLAVPNTDSWDAKHYNSSWAAYDVPRHRWHYNKYAITFLGRQAGFELLSTKKHVLGRFLYRLAIRKISKRQSTVVKSTL